MSYWRDWKNWYSYAFGLSVGVIIAHWVGLL